MNDVQVKYFLTLAKYLNFTVAANHLYITQPAISKQIAALEEEIGTPLFYRTNRSVTLTPAGMIFNETMLYIENIYMSAMNDIIKITQKPIEKIIIGCASGMRVSSFLDNAITAFSERYPQIELLLERHGDLELNNKLADKKLDIIIALRDEVERRFDFRCRNIMEVPIVLVMSNKHPYVNFENVSLSNFSDTTFIIPSADVTPFAKSFIIETCVKYGGFEPKKIVEAPNVESVHIAVENGLGITIVDTLSRLCNDPLLHYSILGHIRKSIVAAWRKDDPNPLIPLLIDLISSFQKEPNVKNI